MRTSDRRENRPWTISEILKWTAGYFQERRIEGARISAELLLAHVLGYRRIDLYVRHEQPLIQKELDRFRPLVKRRAGGEPVAYILGKKPFWSSEFAVSPDVLIPRPETERLLEAALEAIPAEAPERTETPPRRILELGAGSGAVIVTLAAERPGHRYYASDISLKALALARENARRADGRTGIFFFGGDWLAPVKTERRLFDLILSNPPYIRSGDIDGLQPEIRYFEPRAALDGGADGLAAYRRILDEAGDCLKPGGLILLEIGADQRELLESLAGEKAVFEILPCLKDYAGNDRVFRLRKHPAGKDG